MGVAGQSRIGRFGEPRRVTVNRERTRFIFQPFEFVQVEDRFKVIDSQSFASTPIEKSRTDRNKIKPLYPQKRPVPQRKIPVPCYSIFYIRLGSHVDSFGKPT